jgi:hypothetical protein
MRFRLPIILSLSVIALTVSACSTSGNGRYAYYDDPYGYGGYGGYSGYGGYRGAPYYGYGYGGYPVIIDRDRHHRHHGKRHWDGDDDRRRAVHKQRRDGKRRDVHRGDRDRHRGRNLARNERRVLEQKRDVVRQRVERRGGPDRGRGDGRGRRGDRD